MIEDLDLDELRRVPRVSYYFRYPLHRHDFHDLNIGGDLRGHYAAKPLYGRLDANGRVDRSAGYNGDIAALYVPLDAQAVEDAQLVLSHIEPGRVALANGRRNWTQIKKAAEQGIAEILMQDDS